MLLDVSVYSPERIIFEGQAKSVIAPGEVGVFEIQPFHKRLLSRLIAGVLFVDDKAFPIKRGIIKISQNIVTVILEET